MTNNTADDDFGAGAKNPNPKIKKTAATARFVFGDLGHFMAFGFGAGLFPRLPGTVGTLLAFPLYYLMQSFAVAGRWVLFALLIFLGAWLCGRAGRALQRHDDSGMVLDEIAAFYGVLLLVSPQWFWQVLAFVLFRILDGFKPPPISWIDRNIGGGWGVMLDDLAAAAVCVCVLMLPMWAGLV